MMYIYCMQNCLQGLFVDMLPKMIFAQQPSNRVSFLARCRRLQREVPIASDLWWLRRTARRRTLLRLAEVCSVSVSFAVVQCYQFFSNFSNFSPDRSVLPMAQGSANAVPNFARQRPSVDLSCCAQVR